jgi:hypothetical protein
MDYYIWRQEASWSGWQAEPSLLSCLEFALTVKMEAACSSRMLWLSPNYKVSQLRKLCSSINCLSSSFTLTKVVLSCRQIVDKWWWGGVVPAFHHKILACYKNVGSVQDEIAGCYEHGNGISVPQHVRKVLWTEWLSASEGGRWSIDLVSLFLSQTVSLEFI